MSIPETAKKDIPKKCSICKKKFKNKAGLVSHIEIVHSAHIPREWSASRYENYIRTGKTCSRCVVCGKDTMWDESTWKYRRLCDNPKCRKQLSDTANKNMIGKYGKVHLLDDPEMQRKMIYSKRNSGNYIFDGDESRFEHLYDSNPSRKFLEMLDIFLKIDPRDVISPSPHNYEYQYEGSRHIYIPDHYIVSLNLEIEIKESLDNPNKHPKIQSVDKVKEKIKDEVMASIPGINYVKIHGEDYRDFFTFLSKIKNDMTSNDNNVPLQQVIEWVDNLTDVDIEEELNELLQVPVCEDTLKILLDSTNNSKLDYLTTSVHLLRSTKGIYNPELNYDKMLSQLESDIRKADVTTAVKLYQHIELLQVELQRIILDSSHEFDNMKFEARDARHKIQTKLLPMLKKKIGKLSESYHMIQKPNYQNWYIIEKSSISAIKRGIKYKPIFILLSYTGTFMGSMIQKFTGDEYSHASISLNTSMDSMCSFGPDSSGKIGFVPTESIYTGGYVEDGAKYGLYMYMAPQLEYTSMVTAINSFKENADKLKYSMRGIFNIMMGKESTYPDEYFCSEFVAFILNKGNPSLLGDKHYSLHTPGDLSRMKKIIKIDQGEIRNYDVAKIDRKVSKILTERGFIDVTVERT